MDRLTRKEKKERTSWQIKQKEAKRKKLSKVKKRALLLAGIFFAFAVSVVIWQISIISFDDAVKDPGLRERYLAGAVKELGKPEGVKGIIYASTPAEIEKLKKEHNYQGGKDVLMSVLKNEQVVPGGLRKKFTPEIIAVFPYAFSGEILETGEDFKSSLLHEYRHAEVFLSEEAGGVKISVPPLIMEGNEALFKAVVEMDAIRIEIKSGMKLSPSYREDRYAHYLENYAAIWEKAWIADLEFVESLKVKFFEPWMRTRSELKAEIVAGRKSWYLEHPITKRRYHLPKELFPEN